MTSNDKCLSDYDVLIIGGGPSGLSVAIELKKIGVERVAILERETETGGIPRHCGHPPFGMREFKRIYDGPYYAKKLTEQAIQYGVDLMVETTVVDIDEVDKVEKSDVDNGCIRVTISYNDGISYLLSKRVVIATGVRETPRTARLISGGRASAISTTGALQSMIYLSGRAPCKQPIIVGTELVAFSSLLTLRHAGLKPVMMIEENSRITAIKICQWFAKLVRVPILLNTKIEEIISENQMVSSVILKNIKTGERQTVPCDGVIFTGKFLPESTLLRRANLTLDDNTNGPVVNQYGQCSNKNIYACGNLLRPVETAGWCWQEGHDMAKTIWLDLNQSLIKNEDINNEVGSDDNSINISINTTYIKYVMPQVLKLSNHNSADSNQESMTFWTNAMAKQRLQLRFKKAGRGKLLLRLNDKIVWSKKVSGLPERRFLIPLNALSNLSSLDNVSIDFMAED